MKKLVLLLAVLLLPLLAFAESEDAAALEAKRVQANALLTEEKYAEAVPLLEELAANGYAPAMYVLGYHYKHGNITGTPDYVNALEWYLQAAENDHAEAAYAAGGILYSGDHTGTPDYPAALEMFVKGAELGNPKAAFFAGVCYYKDLHGSGAPDYAKAFDYLTQAAAEEHVYSAGTLEYLGLLYYNGHHVAQDDQVAFDYFTKAAELGRPYSMHNLAEIYRYGRLGETDLDQAIAWYLKASDNGKDCAAGHVEDLIAEGSLGESALTAAAEAGYNTAMYALAEAWCSGAFSGNINFTAALEWYLKADAAGHSEASSKIIDLYYKGVSLSDGTVLLASDHAAMLAYLEEKYAAGALDAHGLSWLGWLLCDNSDQNICEPDYARAYEVFQKAADLGDGYSMCQIGRMYDECNIATHDPDAAARFWYEKAIAAGYSAAQAYLDQLSAE